MWLATQHGFYATVQQEGAYHVRSQRRGDLANLKKQVELAGGIEEGTDVEYPFCVVVTKPEFIAIMNFLAEDLNYENFKAQIHRSPDQNHKTSSYIFIWSEMARLQKKQQRQSEDAG